MQLPILGTISSLFSDAGSELKKLLEPWALIAAAVLLALGLAFFYLPVRAGSPALLALEAWPPTWQLIAASALLFATGYLINTLSGFFLALAGGRPLRDVPWLGEALRGWQGERFDHWLATGLAGGEASARAFQRLAYEMPGRDQLAPTALGNVRAATAAYSANQYGAHLDTVWPLVSATLAEKDAALLEQVRGEQTATTFLATLAVLLAAVSPLAMALALGQGAPGRALVALALLLPAYGLYRAAIVRALGWGRLTRAALDLYLTDTGTKLGLRPLAGEPAAARARWEGVSEWLAYGGLKLADPRVQIPVAPGHWFQKPDPPTPANVTCATGVAAELRVAARPPARYPLTPSALRLPATPYDVTVLAAPAGGALPTAVPTAATTAPVAGGFVLVSDTRLPALAPASGTIHYPDGTTAAVSPHIVPGGDEPDAYIWPLPGLAAHGSALLTYQTAAEMWLRAGPGVELLKVAPARDKAANALAVTVRYSGPAGGAAAVTGDGIAAARVGKTFPWGQKGGPAGTADVAHDAATGRVTWAIPAAPTGDILLILTVTNHGLD